LTEKESIEIQLLPGEGTPPVWSGGALLVVENLHSAAPVFRAFDGAGNQVSEFTFPIPGASLLNNVYSYHRFARGFDGSLAVAGSAYADDEQEWVAFVAWISADSRQQTVIRLPRRLSVPDAVAIAADGSIWVAAGGLVHRDAPDEDYDIIWRLDKSGRMLGSSIPRSTVTSSPTPGASFLVSSSDRIGWYARGAGTYLEFSLDGRVINRFDGVPKDNSPSLFGFGLCDDGGFTPARNSMTAQERRRIGGSTVSTGNSVRGSFTPCNGKGVICWAATARGWQCGRAVGPSPGWNRVRDKPTLRNCV
jgi:hypothetical protein